MWRYVALMSLLGGVVPIFRLALHWFVPSFTHWWLVDAPSWLQSLMLVLWPSSLLLIGDPEERNLWFPILATGVNMLLYGMVGGVIWLSRSSKGRSGKPTGRME